MKSVAVAIMLTLSLIPPLQARTVEGVEMPESVTVDDQSLVLNGAGVRSKWFLNLYVGGLYLPEPSEDARQVIQSGQPQMIRLHIISDMITSERMREATIEGFRASTDGHLERVQPKLDQFLRMFDESIQEGDVFDLKAIPGQGIVGYKNGEKLHAIDGHTFKEQVFGIWLSDEPAQASLREAMLGMDD
ncbi:chalcone isomerase-like protein [Tamilnaduibacter salinus]|uniref:Chalcone isomerase-like protein n=1 Tax=Tamilnaduibacter salinus TaxID=1484056 RepID=A0A2U1CT47_9GAMM|nr:chalcone isomerase family protein [Tamilnaduibacter salinus]PVY69630.1 chalcone isomerase-like protein [Tamilnaduibacter salinus]